MQVRLRTNHNSLKEESMASNQVPNKREQRFAAAQQLVDDANTAFKVLTATKVNLIAGLKDASANATNFVWPRSSR
jgi:hypothetical protein